MQFTTCKKSVIEGYHNGKAIYRSTYHNEKLKSNMKGYQNVKKYIGYHILKKQSGI